MTDASNITIRPVIANDLPWVREVFRVWGADFVVTRGRMVYPESVEGFVAEDSSGEKVGLITYEFAGDQCEIVTLDAFEKFRESGVPLSRKSSA